MTKSKTTTVWVAVSDGREPDFPKGIECFFSMDIRPGAEGALGKARARFTDQIEEAAQFKHRRSLVEMVDACGVTDVSFETREVPREVG